MTPALSTTATLAGVKALAGEAAAAQAEAARIDGTAEPSREAARSHRLTMLQQCAELLLAGTAAASIMEAIGEYGLPPYTVQAREAFGASLLAGLMVLALQ